MARVRDVGPDEVPPAVKEVYERFATGYGPFRDQVGVFAHVPSSVAHLMGMLLELREQKKTRELREEIVRFRKRHPDVVLPKSLTE